MNSIRSLIRTLRSGFRPRRWLKSLWNSPRLLGDRYTLEDNTLVTVYTDQPERFAGYQPVRPLTGVQRSRRVKVSLVATARNESATARALFESILRQTRLPDELILIDTGSVDGTAALLRELASASPIPMTVIEAPGANIARGRNQGIVQTRGEVIAVTDFGCAISPGWLESLVAPFEIDPLTQVSAGRYEAVTSEGKVTRWLLGRSLEQIDPQTHLPSGKEVAFTREAWQQVGGYPEWLTLTGEDTYFALELKRTTMYWAFVPEAVVYWQAPPTVWDTWRKAYHWSTGDGEAGTITYAYRWALLKVGSLAIGILGLALLLALALWIGGSLFPILAGLAVLASLLAVSLRLRARKTRLPDELLLLGTYTAELLGFIHGLRRRQEVDARRYRTLRGAFFILAGVPIDDTGGGGRWTQIALELIRRQYLVVFLNKFPKYEWVDLGLQIRHPNLITARIAGFSWPKFQAQHAALLAEKPLTALLEMPVADFQPVVAGVRQAGGAVAYDLLDDWATALGGQWYSAQAEEQLIDQSQVLTATAPVLAGRLERASGRPVALLPNAVNRYLFNPGRQYPRPVGLPEAAWYIIYTGALWGEWFDWELLLKIARAYPQAAMLVIGDYAGQCQDPPRNLHFLGLKPQRLLPAYLAHSQVAIVPWKVGAITQATSPLKIYEYLAMHRPVVAPDIQPLQGLPGVTLANGHADFVEKVGAARHTPLPEAELERFIQANSWQARVNQLLELVEAARCRD